jgi:hypothetical protein
MFSDNKTADILLTITLVLAAAVIVADLFFWRAV